MCLEGRSPLFLYFIATRDMLVATQHATSLLTPRGCSRRVFAVAPTPQRKPPALQANHPEAARGYNSAIPQCRLEILNTCAVPTPYHRRTIVASCSDFALRRNPNMKRRWYGDGTAQIRGWYTHGGRWAGESSRCEDPAPTVGIARRAMRRIRHRPPFAPRRASTGTEEDHNAALVREGTCVARHLPYQDLY